MARLSYQDKARNEQAIRAAMDRLLRGELPPGGRCDLKTLAAEAGVPRTGFYSKTNRDGTTRVGPYQHLAAEFERRLNALQDSGSTPDPRASQIERLKTEVETLKTRVTQRDTALAELKRFKEIAISRLAAQHDEITHLREQLDQTGTITNLRKPTTRGATIYGTCS